MVPALLNQEIWEAQVMGLTGRSYMRWRQEKEVSE